MRLSLKYLGPEPSTKMCAYHPETASLYCAIFNLYAASTFILSIKLAFLYTTLGWEVKIKHLHNFKDPTTLPFCSSLFVSHSTTHDAHKRQLRVYRNDNLESTVTRFHVGLMLSMLHLHIHVTS